jgi:hypothetical protein
MSDHRPFEPSGRLVLVFTAPNIPAGVVARSVLEAEGIPVMVKGESEGPYRVGPVYLLVPEEHEDEARLILEEVEREGAEVDPDL